MRTPIETRDVALGGLFATPIARASDPDTSHEAAAQHIRSGKRDAHAMHVLELVRVNPGKTAWELTESQPADGLRLDKHEIGRRLSDLDRRGLLVRGEVRECSVKGTRQATWSVRVAE